MAKMMKQIVNVRLFKKILNFDEEIPNILANFQWHTTLRKM